MNKQNKDRLKENKNKQIKPRIEWAQEFSGLESNHKWYDEDRVECPIQT